MSPLAWPTAREGGAATVKEARATMLTVCALGWVKWAASLSPTVKLQLTRGVARVGGAV